jgi:hypothetical protein
LWTFHLYVATFQQTSEVMTSTYPRGTLGSVAFLLAATSIKEILIGTTSSGISYQLRDVYSIFFLCRCCWTKMYVVFWSYFQIICWSIVTFVLPFLLHWCKETVSWIDSQQDSKKKTQHFWSFSSFFYNHPCFGTLPSRVLFYMWR